jgi:DNA polymerase I
MTKRPLYILDCYAFIYRSYFAFMNRPLKNAKGENVSAAFGFFRFLFSLFDQKNPGAFAAVFDPKGKTFRHDMYPEYKATRQKTPEDLHAQVPLVEEILRALGLPVLRADGFEADDLIAALATRARAEGRECWIVSGDKDLLQLVGGSVKALRPDSSFSYKPYGPEDVAAEWGVPPDRILDYLSLTGDASDNVPGVPGVGDKTALKLLTEFHGLDELYERISEVKPESLRKKLEAGRESARLSYKLITLASDAPTGISDLEELDIGRLDRAKANPIFSREGMKSLVSAGEKDLFSEEAAGGPAARAEASAAAQDGGEGPDDAEAARGADSASLTTRPELLGPGEYEKVTSESALAAWVERCMAAGTFAFDCETDGLDELVAKVVGFSLSCEPKKACYVPLICPEEERVGEEAARRHLGRLFSAPGVVLVGHNVKFDWQIMRRFGAPMKCALRDTMIAAWLLDTDAPSLALGALSERRLGGAGIAYDEVVPKGASFAMVPADKATAYAAEDADFTLRLHLIMEAELEEAGQTKLYRELEMPVLPILGSMEAAGIRVDSGELRSYGVELERELGLIQADIYKDVGHEFNIASTKQLQEVLFVERKLPTGKKTKTGHSTDTSVLEELAALDPVPRKILRSRSLAKLKSTYVDALCELADRDPRIHTHYMQTGASTGRLSSRDPNLQNIPVRDEEGRRIRMAFTAEPGSLLVSADYSQIELVVLAHLSQDPGLLKAFREGVDVHRRTASLLFGMSEEEVTPDKRRVAKTINFGVIYGMSAFRLSNELGIPRGDAQKFIDAYFSTYAGVRDFIDKAVAEAEERGYSTTILGRRRPIAAINSRNKTEKQAAERVAVNTPIQGSAADIVKLAMLRVESALASERPKARLLLQVHDELIAEAPEKEAPAVAELMKREMEKAIELSLPLRVSVETGRRWGDMH